MIGREFALKHQNILSANRQAGYFYRLKAITKQLLHINKYYFLNNNGYATIDAIFHPAVL